MSCNAETPVSPETPVPCCPAPRCKVYGRKMSERKRKKKSGKKSTTLPGTHEARSDRGLNRAEAAEFVVVGIAGHLAVEQGAESREELCQQGCEVKQKKGVSKGTQNMTE